MSLQNDDFFFLFFCLSLWGTHLLSFFHLFNLFQMPNEHRMVDVEFFGNFSHVVGLPWWLRWWRIRLQCSRPEFDPWVGKIPWRRAWQTTPVFLPGESPWTEEPGGLQSTGSQRVGHEWVTSTARHSRSCGRMSFVVALSWSLPTCDGQPLHCSCSRLSSALQNSLNHHGTAHLLAVPGPNALLMLRMVSTVLWPILNSKKKTACICFLSNIISTVKKTYEIKSK